MSPWRTLKHTYISSSLTCSIWLRQAAYWKEEEVSPTLHAHMAMTLVTCSCRLIKEQSSGWWTPDGASLKSGLNVIFPLMELNNLILWSEGTNICPNLRKHLLLTFSVSAVITACESVKHSDPAWSKQAAWWRREEMFSALPPPSYLREAAVQHFPSCFSVGCSFPASTKWVRTQWHVHRSANQNQNILIIAEGEAAFVWVNYNLQWCFKRNAPRL